MKTIRRLCIVLSAICGLMTVNATEWEAASATTQGSKISIESPEALGFFPPTISPINFTATSFDSSVDKGDPPDTMGAVGLTQYVAFQNDVIRSFSKANGLPDGVLNLTPEVFWASLFPGSSAITTLSNFLLSDPRIRYDELSNRWVITMGAFSIGGDPIPSLIMVAASNNSTGIITSPTDFFFYSFVPATVGTTPTTHPNYFPDFPTLGVDANVLIIGVNVFSDDSPFGAGGDTTSDVFVLLKSSLYNGTFDPTTTVDIQSFRDLLNFNTGVGPYVPYGVDNFDPAPTQSYVVGAATPFTTGPIPFQDRNYLLVISNITSLSVAAAGISGNLIMPVAAGAAGRITLPPNLYSALNFFNPNGSIDTNDQRLCGAHVRNNQLYTCQTVGLNNQGIGPVYIDNAGDSDPSAANRVTRAGARWYQYNMAAVTPTVAPTLVQTGTLFDSGLTLNNTINDTSYWMPSLMTNTASSLMLGYSETSTGTFVNAGFAIRHATDPLGLLHTQTDYTISGFPYNLIPDSTNFFGTTASHRWGDYSRVSLDPVDGSTFWLIEEYTLFKNTWGTRVISVPGTIN